MLKALAKGLKQGGADGLSARNLWNFKAVALAYPQLALVQTASALFDQMDLAEASSLGEGKVQTLSALFGDGIGQTLSGELESETRQTVSAELSPLTFPAMEERARSHSGLEWQDETWTSKLFSSLSFSHLLELARVDVPLERAFYEIECMKSNWSVRELKRQRDSMLFQRVGLSKDKDAVMALAKEGRLIDSPQTIFRDPMVMEFLGLEQRVAYDEPDLEKAILNHLETFMRELGRDFCFVDRQLPIRISNEVYHLDLLFFHRGLKCLIAIDLKIGRFKHTDAGQMNFYLNYIREEMTKEDEQPPIGLLLCADKDEETVYFATGGMENDIRVSRYKLELPSEAELKAFLKREQQFIENQKGQR